jgi:exodeoxyribonuclease III
MKFYSWNVNGLRAVTKKGFVDWLYQTQPDVLGLQEIKAEADQLSDEVRSPRGYYAYFSSCKTRKGYSGVALYSKVKPDKVEYGIGIKRFDDEGRIIIGHFGDLVLLNIYFPNGGGGPERLKYKLEFYDAFILYIEKCAKRTRKSYSAATSILPMKRLILLVLKKMRKIQDSSLKRGPGSMNSSIMDTLIVIAIFIPIRQERTRIGI